MTRKTYRTAQGKVVDLGALLLQNETVRAVGNMNVNARGDVLDSSNTVIDSKPRQVQRQYQKQSASGPMIVPSTSNSSAKARRAETAPEEILDQEADAVVEETVDTVETPVSGGLAAAIARSREIKQSLETPVTRQTSTGLKKI